MRRLSVRIHVVLLVILGIIIGPKFAADAQQQVPSGTSKSLHGQLQTIDSWIADQVTQSHGDWNLGRYSFYIGFCTSGIGDDAAPAKAMRRLAFTLMNSSLAVGDRLTPFAYEMSVYKFGQTVTLTPNVASRSTFVSAVPRTPMPNSIGGHDIERSLYEILDKIPLVDRANTIVLLLNKDNSSQDPDGSNVGLFSENNPKLRSAISTGNYRSDLVRAEFWVSSDSKSVPVSVTALFPAKLVSLKYGKTTSRYPTFPRDTWQPPNDVPAATEKAQIHTKPDVAPPPAASENSVVSRQTGINRRSALLWSVGLAVAAIVVGVFLVALRKRSGAQPVRPSVAPSATRTSTKLETMPGSLRVTIGTDEHTIAPLAKGSTWAITKGANDKALLVDISNFSSPTTPSASQGKVVSVVPQEAAGSIVTLTFVKSTTLIAEAELGAMFVDLQGTAANKCDSRTLKIEPGSRILCRVQMPDMSSKIRLEIVYSSHDQKV